ncbi:unnamed protein product [Dicrocoelium dendriticum]|nr:unnamed protein product [Dicrocoelium dendriticum]
MVSRSCRLWCFRSQRYGSCYEHSVWNSQCPEVNPHASLLFYWEPLKRQVRIEGTVSRLPVAESEAYFSQRPRVSQLSAAVSPQSRVIPSRECLQNKVAELEGVYAAQPSVPMPSNWPPAHQLSSNHLEAALSSTSVFCNDALALIS